MVSVTPDTFSRIARFTAGRDAHRPQARRLHSLGELISLRRLPFLAALLLALATRASAAPTPRAVVPPQTPPRIGQQGPTFTLRDQNGKRISLADAAGTRVVLVFYRGYW